MVKLVRMKAAIATARQTADGVGPAIHQAHVGRQRQQQHVIPALRREQWNQHEEERAVEIVRLGDSTPLRQDERRRVPTAAAAVAAASADAVGPGLQPLRPHRRKRDVFADEQVRRRRVGHGAVPRMEQSEVAAPAVDGRRQRESRCHDAAERQRGLTRPASMPARAAGRGRTASRRRRFPRTARRPPVAAAVAAITAPIRSKARGRLNWPNASSLTRNFPLSRRVSQTRAWTDIRRSGNARTESRTKVHVMYTVSANHSTSAASFGGHVKGIMKKRERRQVLVLIVPVLRAIQRLGGKHAHGSRARHREVDQFRSLVAQQGVGKNRDDDGHEWPEVAAEAGQTLEESGYCSFRVPAASAACWRQALSCESAASLA